MRSDWRISPADDRRIARPTVFIVSAGAAQVTVPLAPDKPVTFDLPTSGVRDFPAIPTCSGAFDPGSPNT
jgi:hypothetical protein